MKPPRKPRPIRARLMWTCIGFGPTTLYAVIRAAKVRRKGIEIPVAVLDLSDEEKLVEQVAEAINGDEVPLDFMEDIDRDAYLKTARAALDSLGLLRRKRKGSK